MTAFCLRPWQETDAVSLVRYADDSGIAANLRDVFPSPYTRPDADNFIRDCLEREGRDQLSRAVVIGGQAAGCITVTRGQDDPVGRIPRQIQGRHLFPAMGQLSSEAASR